MPTPEPNPPLHSNTPAKQEPSVLGRELGGDLPCFVCGYNLRGLSVRSMCPECGTLCCRLSGRVRGTVGGLFFVMRH